MPAAQVARGSRPPSAAPLSAAPVTHPSAPPPANMSNASATMETISRPPSKPPPLPKARSTSNAPQSIASESTAQTTLRGVGSVGAGNKKPATALEKEIDDSLSVLDSLDNGPTGTSLPDDDQADDQTGETLARGDDPPSTEDRADVTSSNIVHPHTLREAGPMATDRPRMTTDPSITTDSALPPPLTVRGDVDAEDPTGSSQIPMEHLLESTHARPQDEEEIVIADDLAEIVDDPSGKDLPETDENTDAGSTVPPYRPEG
jgi:hypothetical protein